MPDNINMAMDNTATIKDYISKYQTDDVVLSSFFLKEVLNTETGKNLIVNDRSLLSKYLPELESSKVKVQLSNSEYRKYRFNPKRLSYDLYGTTELWFLILDANELHSITQFDLQVVSLYDTSILSKMSRIFNLEKEIREQNDEEVNKALLN